MIYFNWVGLIGLAVRDAELFVHKDREMDVLLLLSQQQTNQEISEPRIYFLNRSYCLFMIFYKRYYVIPTGGI